MQKIVVVVECAIEHKGKFLLIKRPNEGHAGGLLAFPGGKVDFADGSEDKNIGLTPLGGFNEHKTSTSSRS